MNMRRARIFIAMAAAALLLAPPALPGAAPPAQAASPAQPDEAGASQTRKIYPGDIVRLELEGENLTPEEVGEAFAAFDIVELREAGGKIHIAVRTFEPGEHRARLRSREIVVEVASTLEDIDRDDVFEGGTAVREAGIRFHWRILFGAAAAVFALSGGALLFRAVGRRNTKPPDPYELFLQRAGALDAESGAYLPELTRHFKTYLESLYPCRIAGKTTAETLDELRKFPPLAPVLPELADWFAECDILKFSGAAVPAGMRRELGERLLRLAGKIHSGLKEGAA